MDTSTRRTLSRSLATVIVVLTVISAAPTVSAQVVHMNEREKIQYFVAFTELAKTKAEAGETSVAKLACVVGFYIIKAQLKIPRWMERHKAQIVGFDKVCDPLWKNHEPDAAGGDAVVKAHAEKLEGYGDALGFAPFANPTVSAGYEEHKRTIDALKIHPEALKLALAYVEKLPNLTTLMTKPPRGFEATYPALLAIATGRARAADVEKDRALPAVLAKLEAIDASISDKLTPGELTAKAAEMSRWLELLETARPRHANVATTKKRIETIEADAERKWKAYVAKTRMPKSKWTGKASVEASLRKAYLARYPKESVERVVIASETWGPARGRGWWKDDAWHWSVFSRLSNVHVAVKQKVKGETQYRMFTATFARERDGSGWGAVFLVTTDHGRPILRENINK